MKFKGTPGEWKPIFVQGICIGVAQSAINQVNQVVCNSILPDTDEEYAIEKEQIEADMNLIAAAPELLEACLKLAEWDKKHPAGKLYPDHEAKKLEQELTEIVNMAKAAIDKALNY